MSFYGGGCIPCTYTGDEKNCSWFAIGRQMGAAGGIVNAIKSVDDYLKQKNLEMDVEVEMRTLEEVKEVLEYVSGSKTRVTRIMLDNMVVPLENGDVDVTMLKDAVELH